MPTLLRWLPIKIHSHIFCLPRLAKGIAGISIDLTFLRRRKIDRIGYGPHPLKVGVFGL